MNTPIYLTDARHGISSQHPSDPLQKHTTYYITPRLYNTIFNNGRYTTKNPNRPHTVTTTYIKLTCAIYIYIYTYIVSRHLVTRGNNKILRTPPSHISRSEDIALRITRRPLPNLDITLPQIIFTQSR